MSRKVSVRKSILWRAIRRHCLACCGGSSPEVTDCPTEECDLYPYRLGRPEVACENETTRSPRCAGFVPGGTISPGAPYGTGAPEKTKIEA